jgi:putative ABC transport system ATP-binding protein
MSTLELQDVSKVYGAGAAEVHALRSVDLVVEPGELVAVMGPSGSGKSTLLTIAGSLEEASSGEVIIGGATLSTLSRSAQAQLRRRVIGYVFQDFNLLVGLTASENVTLPLELDGMSPKQARVVGAAALEALGLGDRRLLLADEPSGALDSQNGEMVMRMIRSTCERGVAGVVVTHDAQLASWADRVVFLRDGRIVDQTRPPAGPEVLLEADALS